MHFQRSREEFARHVFAYVGFQDALEPRAALRDFLKQDRQVGVGCVFGQGWRPELTVAADQLFLLVSYHAILSRFEAV